MVIFKGLIQDVIDRALIKQFNDYLVSQGMNPENITDEARETLKESYSQSLYPGSQTPPDSMVKVLIADDPSSSIEASALTNPEFFDSISQTTTSQTPTTVTYPPVTSPTTVTYPPVTSPTPVTYPSITSPTPVTYPPVTSPTPVTYPSVTSPTTVTYTPVTSPTTSVTTAPKCCEVPWFDATETKAILGITDAPCYANFGMLDGWSNYKCNEAGGYTIHFTSDDQDLDGLFLHTLLSQGIYGQFLSTSFTPLLSLYLKFFLISCMF
jgi:hypothetical protein